MINYKDNVIKRSKLNEMRSYKPITVYLEDELIDTVVKINDKKTLSISKLIRQLLLDLINNNIEYVDNPTYEKFGYLRIVNEKDLLKRRNKKN